MIKLRDSLQKERKILSEALSVDLLSVPQNHYLLVASNAI